MINCKDCKFWDISTHTFKSFDMGECLAVPEEFYFDFNDETQLAFTDDTYNNMSMLVTRPNFGCVMGEEKET